MKKLFLSILLTLSAAINVHAQAQTFNIGGELRFSRLADAQLFGSNDLTTAISGQLQFDLSAPGIVTNDDSFETVERYAFTSFVLNIGSVSLSADIGAGPASSVRLFDRSSTNAMANDLAQIVVLEDIAFPGGTVIVHDLTFSLPNTSITSTGLDQFATFADVPLSIARGSLFFISIDNPDGLVATFQNLTLSQVSAVPEPTTWLMMIIGFVFTGLMAQHRNREHNLIS